jgi:hypothetical protein
MQVTSDSSSVIVVEILVGWRATWKLFLHDRYQFFENFVHLVSREQIGNLSTMNCLTLNTLDTYEMERLGAITTFGRINRFSSWFLKRYKIHSVPHEVHVERKAKIKSI